MRFGSLFSGCGGLDLGLERAGFTCAWQCEIDDYATRVLEKHWPHVRRWRDVRDFPPMSELPDTSQHGPQQRVLRSVPEPLADWRVDLICGGFPCQDISNAGKKAGIDGNRSGLWSQFARVIRILRPRIVVVENVSALLGRGMGRVLGDLADIGYDAEWNCVPAGILGARHFRNRVFIIATASAIHDANGKPARRVFGPERQESRRRWEAIGNRFSWDGFLWSDQPGIPRTAHGIPSRVDRHRVLGNAVVPAVGEYIGRRILQSLTPEPAHEHPQP